MDHSPQAPLAIVQNCYVVRDLEAACQRFHDLFGIGPFVGGSEAVLDNHIYRGQPAAPIRLKGVFGQCGDLNVELVQILSAGPSAFHDMFPSGEAGLHHVAIFADDYEAERDRFVAQGMPVVSEFTVPFGAHICYIDARSALGHMIELYSENAVIRDMYRQTRDARATSGLQQLIVPWQ